MWRKIEPRALSKAVRRSGRRSPPEIDWLLVCCTGIAMVIAWLQLVQPRRRRTNMPNAAARRPAKFLI